MFCSIDRILLFCCCQASPPRIYFLLAFSHFNIAGVNLPSPFFRGKQVCCTNITVGAAIQLNPESTSPYSKAALRIFKCDVFTKSGTNYNCISRLVKFANVRPAEVHVERKEKATDTNGWRQTKSESSRVKICLSVYIQYFF